MIICGGISYKFGRGLWKRPRRPSGRCPCPAAANGGSPVPPSVPSVASGGVHRSRRRLSIRVWNSKKNKTNKSCELFFLLWIQRSDSICWSPLEPFLTRRSFDFQLRNRIQLGLVQYLIENRKSSSASSFNQLKIFKTFFISLQNEFLLFEVKSI